MAIKIMGTYKIKSAGYEVFGANMTVDTSSDVYSAGNLAACKSCQCNCRLCLGGRAPEDAEISCKADAERVLEKLLAA